MCVELDGAGQAGASRAEEGINLGKPLPAALAAIGAAGSQMSAPPSAVRGTAPVPVAKPPPPARSPPVAKPPPPARAPPAAPTRTPPAAKPPPPRAARPFSTQRVANTPPAEAASAGTSSLVFGDKIGQPLPAGWSEGKEFSAGGKFATGDLVIVTRSDGSLKFGEIIKQEGFFGGAYEVSCV